MNDVEKVTAVVNSDGRNRVLIVVDSPTGPTVHLLHSVRHVIENQENKDVSLHLLSFVDDPKRELIREVRRIWTGPVDQLSGRTYLDRVGQVVRTSLSEFTAELRHRLEEIAYEAGGPRWGRRFSEMWWYTHLSEKNSAADSVWWDCLRLESVRKRLSEVSYAHCLFIGGSALCDMVRQLCENVDIRFSACVIEQFRTRWWRLVARRALSGLFFTMAVLVARMVKPCYISPNCSRNNKVMLAYSWAEFWTKRFGKWTEPYYEDALERAERLPNLLPVYALSVYGRPYIPLKGILVQLWSLMRRPEWRSIRFVLFEAQTNPLQVIAEYARVQDIWKYRKMTKTDNFRKSLTWKGIDMTKPFGQLLWRSVLVTWPFLKMQERLVAKLTSRLQPAVTLLYSFEYVVGRAFITGTRRGGKARIIGMQHGPMAPMKFTYSGTPDERIIGEHGSPPLPEPDLYSVEGNAALRILGERGVGADSIYVIGPLRLDQIWNRARAAAQRIRFQGLPIRVLITPGLHDTKFVANFAIPTLLCDERLTIIFKPHPKIISNDKMLREIFPLKATNTQDEKLRLVCDGDVYEWMEKADILIGTYSSTVIEAIAFGLPVILLTSERIPDMSPFQMHNAMVLTANDVRTLSKYVDQLIQDSAFRDYYLRQLKSVVSEVFGELNGGATRRLAALCHDLSMSEK